MTVKSSSKLQFTKEQFEQFKKGDWLKDAKYFKRAKITPTAVMKILTHCQSGVEKGQQQGGNPTEVMGLLLGHPAPNQTMVVTDAYPLPIEGFETRVIADDDNVTNYMIRLSEVLENSRSEKFMGWYHSHPFDLSVNSHCYLSQTDVSTQLIWQRSEDPHGNPFLAIVVDPLRSMHYKKPEMKAFRVYPPDYESPVKNECPDGSVVKEDTSRLEKWGSCWNRYYELDLDPVMSAPAKQVLSQLTKNRWSHPLCYTSALENNEYTYIESIATKGKSLRLEALSTEDQQMNPRLTKQVQNPPGQQPSGSSEESKGSSSGGYHEDTKPPSERTELDKFCDATADLGLNNIHRNVLQTVKSVMFNNNAPATH